MATNFEANQFVCVKYFINLSVNTMIFLFPNFSKKFALHSIEMVEEDFIVICFLLTKANLKNSCRLCSHCWSAHYTFSTSASSL